MRTQRRLVNEYALSKNTKRRLQRKILINEQSFLVDLNVSAFIQKISASTIVWIQWPTYRVEIYLRNKRIIIASTANYAQNRNPSKLYIYLYSFIFSVYTLYLKKTYCNFFTKKLMKNYTCTFYFSFSFLSGLDKPYWSIRVCVRIFHDHLRSIEIFCEPNVKFWRTPSSILLY